MKVRNINGTAPNKCFCGSWLNHWLNLSGQKLPKFCAEKECTAAPEVGAHVQKDRYFESAWYIVPLCKSHNAEDGKLLTLVDSVQLVSANVSETSGR
jgi:hypothetical protein